MKLYRKPASPMIEKRVLDRSVADNDYLCQVSKQVSCGACCGLYNVADHSKAKLTDILAERTEHFAAVKRQAQAILDFGQQVIAGLDQSRPFAGFHHCPFVGLIGRDLSRVGCLLHPLSTGNGGIDFRGLSYYGGMACRVYFCPSCRELSSDIKKCVRKITDNWYEYGLIVTESRLLNGFFNEVAARAGMPIMAERILESRFAGDAVRHFLQLKIDWPFRSNSASGPCNYFFTDKRYPRSATEYNFSAGGPSRYDAIFRELDSAFGSASELHRAERIIENLIDRTVAGVLATNGAGRQNRLN